MSVDENDDDGIPRVWPFSLAGVIIIVGLIWFQLGFAFEDMQRDLWQHYGVFWACILLAVILIIGGGIWNTLRSRRRAAAH